MLVAEISTGFRLLSIAVTDLSKIDGGEDEMRPAVEAESSNVEDSRQLENSNDEEAEGVPGQCLVLISR